MGKRTCRLCGRRFSSGLALAGHMRSHAGPKTLPPSPPPPPISPDPQPSAAYAASSSILQAGDSDAESSVAPPEPISDHDVALSLMMLSRDVWTRSGDDGITGTQPHQRRTGYQCGSCKKVFSSHHALGGHRASRKKLGVSCRVAGDADLVHECPWCFRVFSSGQALGGHKRSHMYPVAASSSVGRPRPPSTLESSISRNAAMVSESCIIDLNQPADMDEWYYLG